MTCYHNLFSLMQRFYTEHDDDVVALAVHPRLFLALNHLSLFLALNPLSLL